MYFLVVVSAFAEHAIGDVITETEAIASALEHHAEKVVRVAAPEAAKEG